MAAAALAGTGGGVRVSQAVTQDDRDRLRAQVLQYLQALAYGNGIVYGGSHANGDTYMYADATSWPELTGWTSRTRTRWMGAWDAERHEFLDWYPEIGTENGEGAWALFVDSTKCLWAGGDFNRGSFDGSVARYVGGFAKFCPGDSTPPAPPTNPTPVSLNAPASGKSSCFLPPKCRISSL